MKENVPSPVLFISDTNGLYWRDPITAKPPPQFVDPLRNTMQKKIAKVGQLYHLMFVMPPTEEMGSYNPQLQHQQIMQQPQMMPSLKIDLAN
jgi:hypothetical protein